MSKRSCHIASTRDSAFKKSQQESSAGCFSTLKHLLLPKRRRHINESVPLSEKSSNLSIQGNATRKVKVNNKLDQKDSKSVVSEEPAAYSPYCFSPMSSSSSTTAECKTCDIPRKKCDTYSEIANSALSRDQTTLFGKTACTFETFDSSRRLELLRKQMKIWKLTAYIIPSEDEHQSEYTAPKDQRREYISGFTGSAGVAIITLDRAALSTDGRYFLQAGRQLDGNWQLLKQGVEGYPDWKQWTVDEVMDEVREHKEDGILRSDEIGTIGVDSRLISVKTGVELKELCFNYNLNFATILDHNLVDDIMKLEHYVPPHKDISELMLFKHELQYSGESTASKLARIRKFMKNASVFAVIVSALDEIAWVLNLRGNDIAYNPVFFSYLVITSDSVKLYVDKRKLSKDIITYLCSCSENFQIYRYNQFWQDLPALDSQDPSLNTVNTETEPSYALFTQLPSIYEVMRRSIVGEFKGIKNETEISGNRNAQLRDSVALCQLYAWLDEKLKNGDTLSEMDVANRSSYYRSQQKYFKGLSFATIASTGPNSAVVHYEPTDKECSIVDPDAVFLCDSGAQYLDGTTDITRTYHFGSPSALEKKIFTLVLNGHLRIAMLQFKQGTSSYYIDSLGRDPLLKEGYKYSHGTGHGIDTYICVHSGPCGLSPAKTSYNYKPLEPGNFLSDEPGCYLTDQFGVRIESDVLVTKSNKSNELAFEYMTLVPFDLNLIDKTYLTDEQVTWINAYHKRVYESISPILTSIHDVRALRWLRKETHSI